MKKSILALTLLHSASTSFASSVCILTMPAVYGEDEVATCDRKEVSRVTIHADTNQSAKTTLILKKLMDEGYKIVSQTTGDYTLAR